jgi:hypothetical protein
VNQVNQGSDNKKNQVNQGSDDCVKKDSKKLKVSNSTPLQKYNIMN